MTQWTGGRIVAEMLAAEGVDTFFGIVDGTYLHLFANGVERGMRMVTPRHETTAMHMAGAYARLTGRLGVCLASNGPGVANVLPGVAVEQAEGNRVLLLTSTRRVGVGYPDRGGTYQYFDQVGTIGPMCKSSTLAPSAERLPEILRKALRTCYEGRPGVVHVDIPESVLNQPCAEVDIWALARYRRTVPQPPPDSLVEQAAALLTGARLPILHAGSGLIHAGAFAELARLAELLHAPVSTSWSARGVLREDHPLSWPMVHMDANTALRNAADVVLVLGARLGETDWWGKAPYWARPDQLKTIQVDLDEGALGRNRPVDLAIQADIRLFLQALVARLESHPVDLGPRESAVAELARHKEKANRELARNLKDRSAPMLTGHVSAVAREILDDDAVMVIDGGNTAVWANAYWEIREPNTQLGTWHFGHLGAGQGQALGAAVARPGKQVCCILGDGAMGFQMQEVETAVRCGLPVVFVVCADQQWGMVKMTEIVGLGMAAAQFPNALANGPAINGDIGPIAWDDLGRAMGAHGERVASPDELAPALRRCLEAGRCAVLHVDVDPNKHLFAPGLMHFKDMHQEPTG